MVQVGGSVVQVVVLRRTELCACAKKRRLLQIYVKHSVIPTTDVVVCGFKAFVVVREGLAF